MNNQPISQIEVSSFIWVRFLSKQFFTAAFCKKQMPRDSSTGKFALESVRREQLAAQAARTARAVARYTGAPDAVNLAQETSSAPPVVSEPPPPPQIPPHLENGPWDRDIFAGGDLVVFSRGRYELNSEAITIRKNPEGFGWYIDFGANHYTQDSSRQPILPE